MGIKGLFTFIQGYVDDALEWHKLHDCKLIIDGSNLAYELYHNCSDINTAFGGDYDKYATEVEIFFRKLIRCNVETYVVMDGGHPVQRSKFRTSLERMGKQIVSCLKVNPQNQSHIKIFPILGRAVFVNTVQKLGITVLQSDFEADDEIVVLAKEMGAFVLSNDSDFYLFDVPFILLYSVNMRFLQKEIKRNGDSFKFIPCYLFNVKAFCEITKMRKELLPALAPILGNDFLHPRLMKNFYDHVAEFRPFNLRMSERHKIIMSVIRWLAVQRRSLDAVLDEIAEYVFGRAPKDKKKKYMKSVVHMYSPSESLLTKWTKHNPGCPSLKGNADIKRYASSSLSKVDFKQKHFLPQKVKWEMSCTCRDRLHTSIIYQCELPSWFIKAYRLHLISPLISNIMNKCYFFIPPQIESISRPSIYVKLEAIVRRIRGVLWATLSQSLHMKNAIAYRPLPSPEVPGHESSPEAAGDDGSSALAPQNKESTPETPEDDGLLPEAPVGDGSLPEAPGVEYIAESKIPDGDPLICTAESSRCISPFEYEYNEKEFAGKVLKDNISKVFLNNELTHGFQNQTLSRGSSSSSLETFDGVSDDEEESETSDEEVKNHPEREKSPIWAERNEDDEDKTSSEENFPFEETWKENVNFEAFQKNGNIPNLKMYIRKDGGSFGHKIKSESLMHFTHFPSLFEVENFTIPERKNFLYQMAQYKVEFNEDLPQNIEFILLCVCFWKKTYSTHVDVRMIFSVLLCLIMFGIIDGKSGRNRDKKKFETVVVSAKKISHLLSKDAFPDPSSMSVSALIQSLTEEECQLAALSLYQFHSLRTTDFKCPYSRSVVHAYSEFQAVVYFLQILNSVLYFPFPSITADSFWSGTFAYNIRQCFSNNLGVDDVLSSLFNINIRIIHLFTRLYNLIQGPLRLKDLSSTMTSKSSQNISPQKLRQIKQKQQKKLGLKTPLQLGISTEKKKPLSAAKVVEVQKDYTEECDVLENPTEEDLIMMAENKFSVLLIR